MSALGMKIREIWKRAAVAAFGPSVSDTDSMHDVAWEVRRTVGDLVHDGAKEDFRNS